MAGLKLTEPAHRILFVCAACGRTADDKDGRNARPEGWDESCRASAVACRAGSVVRNPETGRAVLAAESDAA